MLLPAWQMGDDNVEALNYDNLEAVAHLQSSERYNSIMQVLLLYPALSL